MSDVKTCKLTLLRLHIKAYIVNYPLVKGAMVFKLNGAKRVRNTLKRVLNRMSIVVKRINAPLVSLSVMVYVNNSLNRRVTHIYIRGRHIYLCA